MSDSVPEAGFAPIVIRLLRADDERAFRRAIDEFRESGSDFDFALGLAEGMPFAEYLRNNEAWSRGEQLPKGFVAGSFYVAVANDRIVGRLSIRHELNPYLASVGGHVGYGVVPSARGRGYATAMLSWAKLQCRETLSLPRILVTCDDDNLASRRVIERCGGEFEGLAVDPSSGKPKRRYWVSTNC